MAERAENEGFRVLDDFVCDAIHAPGIPQADPRKQGRNEGIRVIEELVFGRESATKENGKAQAQLAGDMGRFRLPEAVAARLQSLLDRQDAGQPLTPEERAEAEGLVNLSDLLTLLRRRAERWTP